MGLFNELNMVYLLLCFWIKNTGNVQAEQDQYYIIHSIACGSIFKIFDELNGAQNIHQSTNC